MGHEVEQQKIAEGICGHSFKQVLYLKDDFVMNEYCKEDIIALV
jgi:hypothetical protein